MTGPGLDATELRLVDLLFRAGGVPDLPAAINLRPAPETDLSPAPPSGGRTAPMLRAAAADVRATAQVVAGATTHGTVAELVAIREAHR